MNLLSTLTVLLAGAQEGPRIVQMREAAIYTTASRLGGVLRKAGYGEEVVVTAVEGRFAKVTLADGATGYILKTALIAREKFVPAPADEAEKMRLKAEGYEAGRFDPETEKRYRKEKGPAMDHAYAQLDLLEKRPVDRAELERRLREFRREGKLGEFAAVP